MLRFDFLFIVSLLFLSASSQVINIESKRFLNDTNGWVGKMDNYFQLTQNTQQIIALGNNVHMQYAYHEHKFLILNDINFIKAANTDFVNSGYQHLRYSLKIRSWITWESFLQGQYNAIMKIQLRLLGGSGPRFRLVKREDFKLFAACLYMREYEEISLPRAYNNANRLSAYATFSWSITDNIELSTTTFYQPALNDLSDYRIAGDGAFEIGITKKLSLKVNYNFLYDTKQPAGVPNFTYFVRNAIGFKF